MQASSASSSIQASVTSGQTRSEEDGYALEALTDFPDAPVAEVPRVSELPPSNPDAERQALADADARADADRPPPEWCVDTRSGMLAMTTFELWMALARGDVDGKTSVWRDGMDSWENIANVPELAYAMSDSLSLAPPPVIPTPTEVMSVRPNDRTPLGFGTSDIGSEESLDGGLRLQKVPLPLRGFAFGRMKAAAAAVFVAAAAAVGLSYLPTGPGVSTAAAAERPVAVARLQAAMERANRQVEGAAAVREARLEQEAAARRAARRKAEPPPPKKSAKTHQEAGQRRARRGRQ